MILVRILFYSGFTMLMSCGFQKGHHSESKVRSIEGMETEKEETEETEETEEATSQESGSESPEQTDAGSPEKEPGNPPPAEVPETNKSKPAPEAETKNLKTPEMEALELKITYLRQEVLEVDNKIFKLNLKKAEILNAAPGTVSAPIDLSKILGKDVPGLNIFGGLISKLIQKKKNEEDLKMAKEALDKAEKDLIQIKNTKQEELRTAESELKAMRAAQQ